MTRRRRRFVLSQREVTILQQMTRLAILGSLAWAIYAQAWPYVAGNIVALMITWKPWRAN